MSDLFRIAGITDEFAPNLETAAKAMRDVGMTGAELRMVSGRNMVDLSDDDIDDVMAVLARYGLTVVSLASPLLKCVLPDSPPVDSRFQQDVFAARLTYEDQGWLTRRTFDIAQRTGAPVVRVFSFWRVVAPEAVFDRVVEALRSLAEQASEEGLTVGLENEAACNIATGVETARVLAAVSHPALQVVWDPANALVGGEVPYPDGYRLLDPKRIAHVHAKDCVVAGHKPTFGPLGECGVDWKGQIAALKSDGYEGWISLETHWPGPGGDKMLASTICGQNLKALVTR
jgi:L-ribulose-5-phosphate 3-epimerase